MIKTVISENIFFEGGMIKEYFKEDGRSLGTYIFATKELKFYGEKSLAENNLITISPFVYRFVMKDELRKYCYEFKGRYYIRYDKRLREGL